MTLETPIPDRLADRDPLSILRGTPQVLSRLVRRFQSERFRQRPDPSRWAPGEILGHLVDHEIVTTCRIRSLRFDEVAWLSPYDQERWVREQPYRAADPGQLLGRFALLRQLNVEQYAALDDNQWSTAKPHSRGDGRIDMRYLVRRHANHDLHHLDQLSRYLESTASNPAAGS